MSKQKQFKKNNLMYFILHGNLQATGVSWFIAFIKALYKTELENPTGLEI